MLVGSADGITVERVTADTQQTWDRVIARGFAEYGLLPENLFAALGTLSNSLNFLHESMASQPAEAWARDHARGGNCCAVGIGDSS